MEEVTKSEGRTILFVSHNMSAIKKLCKKTIILEHGQIKMSGDTEKIINYYLSNSKLNSVTNYPLIKDKEAQVTKISILNKDNKHETHIPVNENFSIEIEYEISRPSKNAVLSVMFYADGDILLLSSESDKDALLRNYEPGKYKTTVDIPAHMFNVGIYFFDTRFHRPSVELIDHKQNINFEITDASDNAQSIIFNGYHMGKIANILDYKTEKII